MTDIFSQYNHNKIAQLFAKKMVKYGYTEKWMVMQGIEYLA